MELYPLLVNIIAIAAIVAGIAVAVWWVIALFWMHSRKEEAELPELEVPTGIKEVISGVPMALIIFFTFVGLTMICYVLAVWLGGVTY